jgi:hypothetical protein
MRQWHWGKLVILWAWGALLVLLALEALERISEERFMFGTLLVLVIFAVPAVLSLITWKWLGGKE